MASYASFIPQPTDAIGTTTKPGNGLNSMDQFLRSGSNTAASFGAGQQTAGAGYTAQGAAAISPALNFYQSILQGGPTAQAALAPQTAAINSQYNQAQQQQAMLHGRGGGTASTFAQLPYQKIAQENNLWSSMLPAAASGTASAGAALGNLGNQQQQVGNQSLLQALENQLQVRGQDFGQSASNKQLGASLAGSVASVA